MPQRSYWGWGTRIMVSGETKLKVMLLVRSTSHVVQVNGEFCCSGLIMVS